MHYVFWFVCCCCCLGGQPPPPPSVSIPECGLLIIFCVCGLLSSIVSHDVLLTEGGLIVEMLHRRTTDDKVGVRKSGLQALEAIVLMDKSSTRSSVSLNLSCIFYLYQQNF